MALRPSRPLALVHVSFVLLASSCTTPDVAPAADIAAPAVAQLDVSTAEVAVAKAPPTEPTPSSRTTAAPVPPTPEGSAPIPWGSSLQVTGKSHGLRFTTTAQVERTPTTLQLALEVELHNSTRAPMKVSLHPPRVSVMPTPAPGSDGTGIGLGMRGEGFGSDACSPAHGGPTILPPGARASVRRTVELDPLPWPPGQAYRVIASSRDCRPDRLTLEVLDATVVQPASPDGVPLLLAASSDVARK